MNVQFRQQKMTICGGDLFYQQSGDCSDTPIVFLHGWGISADPYREVLHHLAKHRSVIAPDLPTFARSQSGEFIPTYERYAERVLELVDRLGLKRIHLMGHSLGGGIAAALAALAPARIASLVLVNSTGVPVGSIPEVLLRRAIEMPLQISLPKLKLQLIDIPQVFIHNLLFNTDNVLQGLLLSLEGDLRSQMAQISAPCLLLWSEKDFTTPLSVTKEFLKSIPNATLVKVEEGYHEWVLLYPEKFSAIVTRYLQGIEKASTPEFANESVSA